MITATIQLFENKNDEMAFAETTEMIDITTFGERLPKIIVSLLKDYIEESNLDQNSIAYSIYDSYKSKYDNSLCISGGGWDKEGGILMFAAEITSRNRKIYGEEPLYVNIIMEERDLLNDFSLSMINQYLRD